MEILGRETTVTDEHAAAYFFQDLAQANGITSPDGVAFQKLKEKIPSIGSLELPADATLCGGVGRQLVAKGRDTDIAGNPRQLVAHWVRIDLCAIRLPSVDTDILVTLTTPTTPTTGEPQSSSSSSSAPLERLDDLFANVLRSVRIIDWSLFG